MMKRLLSVGCVLLPMLLSSCTHQAYQGSNGAKHLAGASQPVRVSPKGADGAEPAVSAGLDGSVYVVWVEHRPDDKADVWLTHLGSDGKSPGPSTRVNPNVGEATAWRGDPPTVAFAPDGTLYVGWTAKATGAEHASTLFLSASRDGGHSFESPVKVNDDEKPCVHGMHSLAIAADGRIYLAWLDERNISPPPVKNVEGAAMHMHSESNRELFFAFSTDSGHTFSANQRIASEVCPCCKTSLAAAPDGLVYASWRQVLPGNFRHIAVASSTDGGKTFREPVIVSDDHWIIQGCPVSGPSVVVGRSGTLRVLWYTAGDAGDAGLYWADSLDGGKTFKQRHTLTETEARGTPALLAYGSDNFLAVWEGSFNGEAQPVIARLKGEERIGDDAALTDRGELPAAAGTATKIFVAYILKKESRSIWLANL